ncbi:hypothetical protein LZC95_14910 [Pendulispora brunnea]|uniref:Uncharacterized protein n=1 Tax=Pendulispora brunnea TaxID=2905690 RepID=A0ABZ2KM14_9BACT
MGSFVRDPAHWLYKFSPDQWIAASLHEVRAAEAAFKMHNSRAGLAGAKRAAGMALNAALILEPNASWGRTYLDHLMALSRDATVPEAVRAACLVLLETPLPGGHVVALRTARSNERALEAARDVMAHAYAVVKRHAARAANEPGEPEKE